MFKFGIDWSEQHHNLCIRNSKGAIVSQVEFKHTLQGFQRFDDERRKLGCTGSAGNGESPLPNKTLERAWFSHLEHDSTALPGSPWSCHTA